MIYTILSVHEDSGFLLLQRMTFLFFVCPQVISQMCTDDFLRNQLKKS